MFNFRSIKRSPIERDLCTYEAFLPAINHYFQQYQALSDQALRAIADSLKAGTFEHDQLTELLPSAYALVKETCRRKRGLLAYDVQLIAAIALHFGKLIEMQTGEGKTLTALFPAYLNGLLGKGVHILTFNDYLARRDANWSRPVFESLGLTVGYIQESMAPGDKRDAYFADITYSTAKEVGFDYLRSFAAYDASQILQRPFYFALVDEADALMIDEARNPLVLAGDMGKQGVDTAALAQIAADMTADSDFEINDYARNIFLTESGIRNLEEKLQVDNLMDDAHHRLLTGINLALHARMLLVRDVDYVIRDKEVLLIDEFTGRIVADRKWRNGLQTAVEAKEGLPVRSEGSILNTISLQHFLYRYPKLSGMTATARAAAEEFEHFYQLKTVIIPPHKPDQRRDEPDLIYTRKAAKYRALIEDVREQHQRGRPVLIGTLTVAESELLAGMLQQAGIVCQVLNAKQDEREAAIVARAGRLGQVTIATNMAGRGTDITLGGGNPEEREQVLALGGLYIIGTNRHESSRIDRQLRGRAGRRGEVGLTRFYTSLEDDLMIRYKLPEALPKKLRHLKGDDPIEKQRVRYFVEHIQRVIEGQTYEMRRTLLLYADLIEKQRLIIQGERQHLLGSDDFLVERLHIPVTVDRNSHLFNKLRIVALFTYDKHWALHLDTLQQLREGIYLVRYGGQHPLREFQRQSDQYFQELCRQIDAELVETAKQLLAAPLLDLHALGVQRPASTWTYLINDNPFGNQLTTMLLDNSNLGFQVDPFSNALLLLFSLWQKRKTRRH